MTTILDIDDVKVHFGGIRAVDGITAELEPGKLYGIVGPNGSGKTTLVNAITKTYPLTAGRITFGGMDVATVPAHELHRRGLARTYQAIRLLPDLTVRENVMLGADRRALNDAGDTWRSRLLRGVTADRLAGSKADAALERLDLIGVAHEHPDNLPYGLQRRVEIARALAGDPTLLLLDEPVAGMNREERQEIGRVIASLRDDGLTQLLIEHDLRLVLELCDHLIVMNFGRCVAQGEPRVTAELPAVQEAYLGKQADVVA